MLQLYGISIRGTVLIDQSIDLLRHVELLITSQAVVDITKDHETKPSLRKSRKEEMEKK